MTDNFNKQIAYCSIKIAKACSFTIALLSVSSIFFNSYQLYTNEDDINNNIIKAKLLENLVNLTTSALLYKGTLSLEDISNYHFQGNEIAEDIREPTEGIQLIGMDSLLDQ
jgi:hypothetical protein